MISCRDKFILCAFLICDTRRTRTIGWYFRQSNKVTSCNEGGRCNEAWRWRCQSGASLRFYVIFILHSCRLLDTPRRRHLSRRRFHRLNHGCIYAMRAITVHRKRTCAPLTQLTISMPCNACEFVYRVLLLILVYLPTGPTIFIVL